MADHRLQELMAAQLRTPYPASSASREIDGVDMVQLDASVYGVATWYVNNTSKLTDAHRDLLVSRLADLERVWNHVSDADARTFYATVRDLGRYLVTTR